MAIKVKISIGLRDDRGVLFGTLLEVSDRHLRATAEGLYDPGQRVEFRFPLDGYRASVLGQARVQRVVPPEFGVGLASLVLDIEELDPRCQAVFREWLYDQAHGGGTPSRPHERLVSSINSTVSSDSARARDGQRRLDALDAARAQRLGQSVPPGHSAPGSDLRQGVGRAAMREALRNYAGPQGEAARPAPASGPPPSHGGETQAGGAALEVRLSDRSTPAKLLVRFHDKRRFLDMVRDHIDRDMLFVRVDGASLPVGAALSVRMALPAGEVLLCDGLVLAALPSGFGVKLELTDGDRSQVQAAAAASLRSAHRAR